MKALIFVVMEAIKFIVLFFLGAVFMLTCLSFCGRREAHAGNISIELELDRAAIPQTVQDKMTEMGFVWTRTESVSNDRMTFDVVATSVENGTLLYNYLGGNNPWSVDLHPFCLGAWNESDGSQVLKDDETPYCPFNKAKWLEHQEDAVRIRYYSDPPDNTNLVVEFKRVSDNEQFGGLVLNTPTIAGGREYTRMRPTLALIRSRHQYMGWAPKVM